MNKVAAAELGIEAMVQPRVMQHKAGSIVAISFKTLLQNGGAFLRRMYRPVNLIFRQHVRNNTSGIVTLLVSFCA